MFGVQWHICFCLVYLELDDVIVVGKTFEDMIKNLEVVFDRLKISGLQLKKKKCTLFTKSSYNGRVSRSTTLWWSLDTV